MKKSILGTLFVFSLGVLAGCASFANHDMSTKKAENLEPCSNKPENASDMPLIGIALSGGGFRAAAFSYGVMLELDRFCINDGKMTYIPNGLEKTKSIDTGRSENNKSNQSITGNVLNHMNYLSAISGGTIPAGYLFSRGLKNFRDNFRQDLKTIDHKKIVSELLYRKGPLLNGSGFKFDRYYRPFVSLVTSILDLGLLPFSPLLDIEITPMATLLSTDGLLGTKNLSAFYDDIFFDRKKLADSIKKRSSEMLGKPELLINATDIRNGRIFTFDKTTFDCVGSGEEVFNNVRISDAAAVSSSIPGLFSPMDLSFLVYGKALNPSTIPSHKCPAIFSDQVRRPILVDGGISDNLGVIPLLDRIFQRYQDKIKDDHLPAGHSNKKKKKKAFLIIVNAGANTDPELGGLVGILDGSFESLMRDKTDLSRNLSLNMLAPFGIEVVELRFSDLVELSPGVKPLLKNQLTKNRLENFEDQEMYEIIEQIHETGEMDQKVLQTLNRSGLLPSPNSIDTLIAAGRSIVARKSQEILGKFNELYGKRLVDGCNAVTNPRREYCWPKKFQTPHLLSERIGKFLPILSEARDTFVRNMTQNQTFMWDSFQLDMEQFDRLEDAMQNLKWEDLEKFLSWQKDAIKDEKVENNLLGLHHLRLPDKDIELAIERMEIIRKEEKKNAEDSLAKTASNPSDNVLLRRVLERWEEVLIKICNNKTPTCFNLLAYINYRLGKYENMFQYFHKGLVYFPLNRLLLGNLGYYKILLNKDYESGLMYLKKAMIRSQEQFRTLELLQLTLTEKERKESRSLMKRLIDAKSYYTTFYVHFTALAPASSLENIEKISNHEISRWLRTWFPPRVEYHGNLLIEARHVLGTNAIETEGSLELIDLIKKQNKRLCFAPMIQQEINRFVSLLEAGTTEKKLSSEQGEEVGEILGDPCDTLNFLKDDQPTPEESDSLSPQKFDRTMSTTKPIPYDPFKTAYKKVREVIELSLNNKKIKTVKVQDEIENLIGDIRDGFPVKPSYPSYEATNALGLIILRRNFFKECPARSKGIKNALEYFERSWEEAHEGQSTNYLQLVLDRIKNQKEFAVKRLCTSIN